MSTYVYLACLDHSPPLIAEDESQQHAAEHQIDHIRDMVMCRGELLAVDLDVFEVGERYDRNTLRFLAQHPECRVAARTEYGDWLDLGMGIPDTGAVCIWKEPHRRELDARSLDGCGWRTLHKFEPARPNQP